MVRLEESTLRRDTGEACDLNKSSCGQCRSCALRDTSQAADSVPKGVAENILCGDDSMPFRKCDFIYILYT